MNSSIVTIDWKTSMDRLSIGAFYLLNVLWRFDLKPLTDEALMGYTGLGLSTHRKHKKELVDQGYLTVEQIGKSKYTYTVKDGNNVNR